MSSRQIAKEIDIPDRIVRNIIKKHVNKSYKSKTTEELFPDDCIRRMEFCETMREKIDENDNFIKHILFTDESSFSLQWSSQTFSRQVYWSQKNKHFSVPLRTQYPQKINIWAGIFGDKIV